MKVLVIENHQGEGVFPLFTKGTKVENIKPCEESEHWFSCTINNIETFLPKHFLDNNDCLSLDYNPTEMVINKGSNAEVLKIVHEWLYVKKDNEYGWIPASKVVSI